MPNARQMTHGGKGVIYVGSRREGKVRAVQYSGSKASAVTVVDEDLNLPTGVAYKNGSLYVGAVSEILEYKNIDAQLASPPEPKAIVDDLPTDRHHGWKFIDFGPDGQLYAPVGAPCNICLSEDPRYTAILRMDIDNPKPEIYVTGVRNTVGFDWHPTTGELWFSDNGRDLLGDEFPPCELNVATQKGQHFGYPFFHADGKPDPEFGGKGGPREDYVEPALLLGPHVAPLGVHFYLGHQLPIHHQALIAEHGSWNRTPEAGHTGYRVTLARSVDGKLIYEVLIDGWLDENNEAWGRPVDFLELEDGSLLISDDKAGVIYRLTYSS